MATAVRRWLPFLVGAVALVAAGLGVTSKGLGGASKAVGGEGARSGPEIERAIDRGVAYLVRSQNPDGSWGSPASNLWDIYAPAPGSYIAFQVAAVSLAISGIVDADVSDAATHACLDRAVTWLLANAPKARRVSADTLYNVWAQAYVLECLARLLARERDPARADALRRAADVQVDLLRRFEFVDGGWGYYNFDVTVARPEHGATSFTTAAVLVALRAVEAQGVRVPRRLVDRGLALIETCRKPDWSVGYAWDHRFSPSHPINKWNGSLARTPSCQAAYLAWGRPVPAAKLVEALDRLRDQGRFLQIARKYPIPHETWFYNSGYFAFFGYAYAALLLDAVPKDVAARHRAEIAKVLVPLQERDGSFWDYQLYSYHKAYGTGYVLQALSRCRPRR